MKIVISGYIGKKITGIGRNLISLLDNASSDNEYVVYTNYDLKDDLVFNNQHVSVKTYNISKSSSLKNLLWTTFVFPIVVAKEKADKGLIPNFTLLIFKFRPTIVIMHDLIEFNVPEKFSKLKMFYRTRIADPITAKRANKIITVSENSKKDIVKFLGIDSDKISVVYNGVDQQKFQRMDEGKASKILESKNWPNAFIMYAGTVDHPGKNAISVIKAFEVLKENDQYNGSLVLAGMPGSGYEFIEEYVNKSKFRDEIIITGFVTDEELIALYSTCATFVFVSLYEGFGIPPLEALACGAKVVVSNTSSLPEVVGDVGITVDPMDQNAITEAVYHSIQIEVDDEYKKKVLRHLEHYDWKNLSRLFEQNLQR